MSSLPVLLLVNWLVLQLWLPTAAVSIRILSHPHPVVLIAPLNSVGEFNCTVQGHTVDWIIDGIPIIQTHPSRRLDFNAVLINLLWEVKLTVPAIEDNNNTRVQCRAIGDGSILDSNPAVFKIQGFLAAPDGFHAAHVTESNILFRWDVPFTLDITHVEPDIAHYTVYVRNVNTSRTAAINVTRPEFAFTGLPGEVPDPFTLYEFHISAWNVVGEGEKSGPVQASFLNRVRSTGVSPATDSPSLSSETEILLKPTELDLPATNTDVQETSSIVTIPNTPDPNVKETSIVVISISLGSVGSVLLLTLTVILLLILVTRYYIHKANHPKVSDDITMKVNSAYEITKMRSEPIKVEQNSAYGILPPGYRQ